MRIAFLVIVFVHGLIHLLGFVKGFGIREIKELTLPISRPMGVLWLTSAVLLMSYSLLYFVNSKYSWLLGFLSVIISQMLVFVFWEDAKMGTIPNILVLLVSIVAFSSYQFQNLIQLETNRLLSRNTTTATKIINENDILHLPDPVKNWLRKSGTVGSPFISYGQLTQKLDLQMKPHQKNWRTGVATQYTTIDSPAFIWTVEVPMNSLFYFQGRDKFENGKGEMLIKINSLINVVLAHGEKLDEGTLQRYLGEMVWFPSLALSPYLSWEQINDTTAKASMNYKGTKGSGKFFFDREGNFVKFMAMRYKDTSADAKRHEWVLTVDDYQIYSGIKVPSKMKASWILDGKEWNWLVLQIIDLKYNGRM